MPARLRGMPIITCYIASSMTVITDPDATTAKSTVKCAADPRKIQINAAGGSESLDFMRMLTL